MKDEKPEQGLPFSDAVYPHLGTPGQENALFRAAIAPGSPLQAGFESQCQ